MGTKRRKGVKYENVCTLTELQKRKASKAKILRNITSPLEGYEKSQKARKTFYLPKRWCCPSVSVEKLSKRCRVGGKVLGFSRFQSVADFAEGLTGEGITGCVRPFSTLRQPVGGKSSSSNVGTLY